MAASGAQYSLRGVHVSFPFEPYPSQLVFMERVIETLQAPQRNALLESPTGTGKTLCLLCASLAWREMHKAHRQAEQLGLHMHPQLKELAAGATAGLPASEPAATPSFGPAPISRIIYMSRTHGQLSQVVRELRNTTYRPSVSLLGSRQQFCVHSDVKKVPGGQRQNTECQKLVSKQACQFHRNVTDHKYQHREVLTAAMDIEDLVKHGEKHKVCPYFLTRDTANDADIIFMPYNYLTDPTSRRSLSNLWKDSIVIFDEAHNMESICSEAASFDLTATDVCMCLMEIDRCRSIKESGMELTVSESVTAEELDILKCIVKEFENALAAIPLKGSPPSNTFCGSYIYDLFESAGVMKGNAQDLMGVVSRAISLFSEAQPTGLQSNPALKKFLDALEAVFKSSDMANANRLYKVHVTQEAERKAKRSQGITDLQPSMSSALLAGQKPRQVGYWCFSAGVTMLEILDSGVRNVLLASGTLSPMSSWPIEMHMKFEVMLENSHVIQADQLLAAVVRKGPSGAILNSSFKNRDNMSSGDDLGNLIVNVARVVPSNSGVLVFFPSYAVLQSMSERWKQQGSIWDRIDRNKKIFVEPRESANFKLVVDGFTAEVDRTGSNGAVLMAVCRGKMSEGIDFADRHGRAVIVTGIPFPAAFDPRVMLKRSFMDELVTHAKAEGREPVSGEQWYMQQAARAVNQAIGRVIRHRKDFGVILLCDERFAGWTKQSLLSKWMNDKVQVLDHFGPVVAQISQFFQRHKQVEGSVLASAPHVDALQPLHTGHDGLVAIHSRPLHMIKARRQQEQKVATGFAYEKEYLLHKAKDGEKDKKRDITGASGLLGSWMSELDGQSSQSTCASAKPHEKATSLADQLMSMRTKAPAAASARPTISHPMQGNGGMVTRNTEGVAGAKSSTPATIERKLTRGSPTSGWHEGEKTQGAQASRNGRALGKMNGAANPTDTITGTSEGTGKDATTSAENSKAFMDRIKSLLAKDEYSRFKRAMKALHGAPNDKIRTDAFDELHAVLNMPPHHNSLRTLFCFLSSKLQQQMRAHLSATKGLTI